MGNTCSKYWSGAMIWDSIVGGLMRVWVLLLSKIFERNVPLKHKIYLKLDLLMEFLFSRKKILIWANKTIGILFN
jgi:ribosome biogenesis protein Nip4